MFGSAFRNAGRRAFNFGQRRNISSGSWSGDYEANIVFGGEKVGASDIGAFFGAITGAAIIGGVFTEAGDTKPEKAMWGVAGVAIGGVGGGMLGAILTTPIGIAGLSASLIISAANSKIKAKEDSGKSR